jgi:hypothetical protein
VQKKNTNRSPDKNKATNNLEKQSQAPIKNSKGKEGKIEQYKQKQNSCIKSQSLSHIQTNHRFRNPLVKQT